ncbi:MAG: hypothetical protein O7C75_21295 [Verrucomicrobia bacterium]|nr:hypothetical protein [Verrucomicrobiota bacterium]
MSPVIKRIGIGEFEILTQRCMHGMVYVEAMPLKQPERCVCCGGNKLHSKGPYQKRVRHLGCFGHRSELLEIKRGHDVTIDK